MNRLAGYTYNPQYSMSIIDWLEERKRRQEAVNSTPMREGESSVDFESRLKGMPSPRSWSDFLMDPQDNGAQLATSPTDSEKERFGLERPNSRTHPNYDALPYKQWWNERTTPGRNDEFMAIYKGYVRDSDAPFLFKLKEQLSPSVFTPTGAGDVVPTMFNLFQNSEGRRIEAHTYNKWYKRLGANFVQGLGGSLAMMLIGGVVIIGAAKIYNKTAPPLVAGTVQTIGALDGDTKGGPIPQFSRMNR